MDLRARTSPTRASVPPRARVGEYNGKFMVNQLVLRGRLVPLPRGHLRATYRNFFPPAARWQVTGHPAGAVRSIHPARW